METQRRFAITGTVAAAAMMLSACGAIGGEGGGSTAQGPGTDYGNGQAPAAQQPQVPWTLQTASNPQLGKITADGKGLTLYTYAKDRRNQPRSACVKKCAETWPPALVETTNMAAQGLDITKIGRFRRADNKKWQLTYFGWPLYRFSKDAKQGDVNGQKVKGWFILSWRGKRVAAQGAGGGAGNGANDDAAGAGGAKKKKQQGGGGSGGSGGGDNGGGGNGGGGDDGGYGY